MISMSHVSRTVTKQIANQVMEHGRISDRLKLCKRQNRHNVFGLRNAFPCRVVIN